MARCHRCADEAFNGDALARPSRTEHQEMVCGLRHDRPPPFSCWRSSITVEPGSEDELAIEDQRDLSWCCRHLGPMLHAAAPALALMFWPVERVLASQVLVEVAEAETDRCGEHRRYDQEKTPLHCCWSAVVARWPHGKGHPS